jgi:nicotinamide mononucleotide transporter
MSIIGVSAYAALFLTESSYANFTLQFVFLAQSIYGWYFWNKKENTRKVTHIKLKQAILLLLLSIVIEIMTFWIITHFTKTPETNVFMDSASATLSIVALYLMGRKVIEHWVLWVIADVIFIAYFIHLGLYLSSVLYVVFFVLSINGYRSWSRINSALPSKTATLL